MEIQRTNSVEPSGSGQSLLDAFVAKVRGKIRASSELAGKTLDSQLKKYGGNRAEIYFKTPDGLDKDAFEAIVSKEAKSTNSENGFSVDNVVLYDNLEGGNRDLEKSYYVVVHVT